MEKEATRAIKSLRSAEARWVASMSAIIVSVVWTALLFVSRTAYNSKVEDVQLLRTENTRLQRQKDSLQNVNNQNLRDQLGQANNLEQLVNAWDSLNTELRKIKGELKSK